MVLPAPVAIRIRSWPRNWRRAAWIAVGAGLLGLVAMLALGESLTRARHHEVGAAPPDLQASDVAISMPAGGVVRGWYVSGRPGAGSVLLLHGVRSDRRQMLSRARFLRDAGYATLSIDLPAHGESSGDRIAFGAHEAAGVVAALAWLQRRQPGEPVGVIGVSLGAAAFVLADARPAPEAVVLESMYPTVREATRDRLSLRLGAAGASLAPLLLLQLPLWSGVAADDLQPIVAVRNLHSPVLVVGGSLDQHTTIAETRRIYAAATAPKDLWEVPGAAHVDVSNFAPAAYRARILPFLARHMARTH